MECAHTARQDRAQSARRERAGWSLHPASNQEPDQLIPSICQDGTQSSTIHHAPPYTYSIRTLSHLDPSLVATDLVLFFTLRAVANPTRHGNHCLHNRIHRVVQRPGLSSVFPGAAAATELNPTTGPTAATMDDFGSESDSDYTSYWRDWVSLDASHLPLCPLSRYIFPARPVSLLIASVDPSPRPRFSLHTSCAAAAYYWMCARQSKCVVKLARDRDM